MKFLRPLFTSVVAIGAAVGAFGVAAAVTSPGADTFGDAPVTVERHDLQPLMPADSGKEPRVFSSTVSAISGGKSAALSSGAVTITLRAGLPGQVCTEIKAPSLRGGGCAYLEDVATGASYGAFQGPDKAIYIVGIVPDDAASVSIAGQEVQVESNMWFFKSTPGNDLSFVVRSGDGKVSASVG